MKCPGCGYHVTSKTATSCKLCGNDLTGGGKHGGHAAPRASTAAPAKAAAPRPEWQRHMLLRVGAPPIEVKTDRPFTIGRAAEATLSIPSPRVSRNHAELVFKDGKAILRDLGSQNGTTVNGVKVGEHTLADHDEVAIGPYTVTYRCLSGYGSVGKMQGLLDSALHTQPMLGDTLSGQLAQTPLFEALQMLEVSQKTGQVDVLSEDRVGKVVLDEGRIIHASEGDETAVPALHRMLAWRDGMFRFTSKVEGDPPQNLKGNLTILMIEAARTMDQEHGAAP